HQLAPKATTIAMLVGPSQPETVAEQTDVQKAAQAFGQQVVVADATSAAEINAAFAKFVERGAGALLVGTGAFTNSHREAIVALAARRALPAMYLLREFASTGGPIRSWPHITPCRRPTRPYPAAAPPRPTARPASRPAASSRARRRPTCQSCSPANSSSCSTSRPPGRSALTCRTGC